MIVEIHIQGAELHLTGPRRGLSQDGNRFSDILHGTDGIPHTRGCPAMDSLCLLVFFLSTNEGKNFRGNRVRIDDVGSILKVRVVFPFGESSTGFAGPCGFPDLILNFRVSGPYRR